MPWHHKYNCIIKSDSKRAQHCAVNAHSYLPFPPSRTVFNVILSLSGSHGGLLKLYGATGFMSNSDCTATKSSSCLTSIVQCSCSITTDSQPDKSQLTSAALVIVSAAASYHINSRLAITQHSLMTPAQLRDAPCQQVVNKAGQSVS